MSDELLIAQCSPTMAGLKTGSLFTCPFDSQTALVQNVQKFNLRFRSRGIRLLVLKFMPARALLYMYRPSKLRTDLQDATAAALLSGRAYPVQVPEQCLAELIRRLHQEERFPHEIGLFLGYPPQDVQGFMEQGARKAKYAGHWKVYGDEAAAKRKFAQYDRCTQAYSASYRKHHSFDRLIVSCS